MCLIIASPQGIIPTEEILENAAWANDDGWGVSWTEGGKLYTRRSPKMKGWTKAVQGCEGKPYIAHVRLATAGGVSQENCHPFRVAANLHMAHNGILNCVPEYRKDRSDTWHLVELLSRMVRTEADRDWLYSDMGRTMLESWVGKFNKLAFLDAQRGISLVHEREGHWENGMWFSNYGAHVCTTSYYHQGWDGEWWDDMTGPRLKCPDAAAPQSAWAEYYEKKYGKDKVTVHTGTALPPVQTGLNSLPVGEDKEPIASPVWTRKTRDWGDEEIPYPTDEATPEEWDRWMLWFDAREEWKVRKKRRQEEEEVRILQESHPTTTVKGNNYEEVTELSADNEGYGNEESRDPWDDAVNYHGARWRRRNRRGGRYHFGRRGGDSAGAGVSPDPEATAGAGVGAEVPLADDSGGTSPVAGLLPRQSG